MSVMPTDQTAPAELELVRAFVNTLDVEEGTDALDSREGARLAGGARASATPRRSMEEADRERLVEVREALRQLLLANNLSEPRAAGGARGAQRAVGEAADRASLRRPTGPPSSPAAAASTRRSPAC